MNYLSVCSGIEAATVAWHPLGWSPVLYSEIEKFPRRVLTHHYPAVRLWGDFTAIRPRFLRRLGLPMPALLVGGTPCQAFSVAGARRSLDDARGNLTLSFVRLAHALANTGSLRNVVWENVPGVLSTKDNAFGCFLGALVGGDAAIQPPGGRSWPNSGMVSGPKGRAAWTVKYAQYFGLAQRRRRVFVVADFGNGADPAAVLFEPVSLLGNFAPRREAGQGVAAAVTASPRVVSGKDDIDGRVTQVTASDDVGCLAAEMGQGNQFAMSGHYIGYAPELSRCVATREGSPQDYETTTMVAHAIQAGALRTNPESGPDGVGVQEGVAYTIEARAEVQAVCITGEITHTLKAEGFDASEDGTGLGQPLAATSFARQSSFADEGSEEIAGTLVKNQTMAVHLGPAVAVAIRGRDGGATAELGGDVATALRASSGGGDKAHILISAVRRLTPKEFERLQGFPDDYTKLPDYDADGPRYKALGNSMAVPCMRWIGERIAANLPAANDNRKAERTVA